MTQQEKRVKIAVSQGWKWFDHPDVIAITKTFTLPDKWVMNSKGELTFPHSIPNYFEDLNACAAFSQVLDEMDRTCPLGEVGYRMRYGNRLVRATNLSNPFDASAAIRSEEFGLELGLWKEERE